jgi:predicted PurR-regulated permease PerM
LPSKNIIISTKTILSALFILGLGWVIYEVRSIVLSVFISLILALAFDPLVDWLQKRRVPRGLGVIMTYVLVMVLFVVLSGVGFGSLADQLKGLLFQLKAAADSLAAIPTIGPILRDSIDSVILELTPTAGSGIFKITVGAFSSVISVVTVLVFTAYLLLDFKSVRKIFLSLFSRPTRVKAEKVVQDVESKLGSWLRAQLILMVIVGGMTFLGLWLLGVRYALPLALIAGLFEIVPIIGPIISAIPGVIVGFSISPLMGLGVLALYILVQQLENNLIVPKVMQKTIGFNPLATMLALMVGGTLFGFVGVLLAIPATLTGYIIFKHLLE